MLYCRYVRFPGTDPYEIYPSQLYAKSSTSSNHCCITHETSTSTVPAHRPQQLRILHKKLFIKVGNAALFTFCRKLPLRLYCNFSLFNSKVIWICQEQFPRFQLVNLFWAMEEVKIDFKKKPLIYKYRWIWNVWSWPMSTEKPRLISSTREFRCLVRAVRWADEAQCHINGCSSLTNPNSKSGIWDTRLY